MPELVCAARVRGGSAYQVPAHPAPLDLDLRGNEGALPDPGLFAHLRSVELLRRYPDTRPLREVCAAHFGVAPERVLITAGGDDGLDRLCRATLEPGRDLLMPTPGFEMTRRYAALAGAQVRAPEWPGARFPVEACLEALDEGVGLTALTTPNNPTGAVIGRADLEALITRAQQLGSVVLVDLAYVEFADEDPTAWALEYENVVVLRTLSKAWGLAGLRVGVMLGHPKVLGWMAAAGAPYAVAAPSLALAQAAVEQMATLKEGFVAQVRSERLQVAAALEAAGCAVVPSQANFVFARSPRAAWLADGLAGLGIGVRSFPGQAGLEDALRVALPPTEADGARLRAALRTWAQPSALLVDAGVSLKAPLPVRCGVPAGDLAGGWVLSADPARIAEARRCALLPVGLRSPSVPQEALFAAGAARVLERPEQILELLP